MKKNLIIGAAIAIAVMIGGAGVTFAQTNTSATQNAGLEGEIQALLAQVQVLQQELAQAIQSGNTTSAGIGWCHIFTTNLSLGNSGSEVQALQTALQKQNVSVNITGIFDSSTAAAVTAFQQKYSAQILAPIGLSTGTGFVGSATRSTLNNLFRCVPTTVFVQGLNPSGAPVGASVTITGTGFSATGNNVHFGVGGIANVSSSDGTHLTFQVPSNVGPCDLLAPGSPCALFLQQVTPGSYPVLVSNNNGTSNTLTFVVISDTTN